MPKAVYDSMDQVWLLNKLDNNCFAIGNDGYQKGWQKC